ncbi:MAG: aminotransferase class V-fold PLP-dependent enzyme [Pseudonocardia sp.]|uniref:aminotransferase class V-fold PLP-dependent enzyme n=1 Tax=unclassified Pseudonocardia TaxID=2619320 RepID=UPI000B21B7CA|nr:MULTISPECIES: aminotransferase class V-fold PLP-dependent enzyme [unclassified Pseudonocardia]MBN9107661.1 aminotransferase class V-fold PLP-dependent enzyme [Pseudonocardia sp.]
MPTQLAATCTTVPADTDAATGATLPAVLGAGLPVPVVDGTTVPHANLDLAASAPALQYVADRVAALLPYHASVHRGAGYASQVCTAALEAARRTVGRFVGARADDVVVFTRNTTDALNLLAGAVPGSVLCLDVEHHANLLAWRGGSHRILRAAATVDATLTDLRDALADTPTALVAVTGASNVTGEVLPLAEIARIAHEAGARIVVDAAQLAPHRRVDIESAGIDYVALSGHKLYAPFGSGALVGRRDWLDVATPYLAGGGAVQRVTAAGTGTAAEVSWAPAPHRHEAGTPNVPGAVALAAACEALDACFDDAVAQERALSDRLGAGLESCPGVRPLRIWHDAPDRVGVHTFVVDGHPAGLVAAYLSAEHGISVRDGKFCAHPLVDRLTGWAEGAVRAGLGLGTTASDVDRLVAALHELVENGPRWTYECVDGRWVPVDDPRDLDPLGLGGTTAGTGHGGCGH